MTDEAGRLVGEGWLGLGQLDSFSPCGQVIACPGHRGRQAAPLAPTYGMPPAPVWTPLGVSPPCQRPGPGREGVSPAAAGLRSPEI